jgi:ABC-type nitrate/sulfonate/bicarbonate transport system permease component
MTDVMATPAPAEHAAQSGPRLVKMHRFGAAEGSTLPISLVSGAVILAVWCIVTDLRLCPIFLPTPMEVARLRSHFRMARQRHPLRACRGESPAHLTAAAIAIVLGPIGLLWG